MTDKAKLTIDRWLPHVITIAVLAGGGLISYGSLTAKMDTLKEQNAALWKEVYYLRQRIDSGAAVWAGARSPQDEL